MSRNLCDSYSQSCLHDEKTCFLNGLHEKVTILGLGKLIKDLSFFTIQLLAFNKRSGNNRFKFSVLSIKLLQHNVNKLDKNYNCHFKPLPANSDLNKC